MIDDNRWVRDFLGDALRDAGYRVVLAENGVEGLAHCRQEAMALVVTDLYMPDMEGLELIRILRREQPGLPIVAISGGGNFRQRTALSVAERFGAVRVLEKPVDVATLQRVVGECLSAPRES